MDTLISATVLKKNAPAFEPFIFHCDILTSFERVFFMKAIKCRLFKKYLKRKKNADTVFFVPWLTTYLCKWIIENCRYVIILGSSAHKAGKTASFWSNFDPFFPIFREKDGIKEFRSVYVLFFYIKFTLL